MVALIKILFHRYTLYITIIAALILLTLWGFHERSAKQEAISERDQAIRIANHKSEETTFYKNKLGDVVAKTKQVEITSSNLKKLQETEELKFTKNFNGKPKQIESATEVNAHIDETKIPLVKKDSVVCYTVFLWKLKDEFNDIEALVIDTPTFKVTLPVDLAVTWERRRKWLLFFSRKDYFTQVTSPNSLVKIDSVRSFDFKKK